MMSKRKDPFERLTEEVADDIKEMLIADIEDMSIYLWVADEALGTDLVVDDLKDLTDEEIDKIREWVDEYRINREFDVPVIDPTDPTKSGNQTPGDDA